MCPHVLQGRNNNARPTPIPVLAALLMLPKQSRPSMLGARNNPHGRAASETPPHCFPRISDLGGTADAAKGREQFAWSLRWADFRSLSLQSPTDCEEGLGGSALRSALARSLQLQGNGLSRASSPWGRGWGGTGELSPEGGLTPPTPPRRPPLPPASVLRPSLSTSHSLVLLFPQRPFVPSLPCRPPSG